MQVILQSLTLFIWLFQFFILPLHLKWKNNRMFNLKNNKI